MAFTLAISEYRVGLKKNYWLMGFLGVFFSIWAYSFLGSTDYANWVLENALVMVFLLFLFGTYKEFKFSDLSYLLICVYMSLHVYGSMHTYAENPFGYWLQDFMGSSRNHYDRIVHFSFGFLLAYPMRELFLSWLRFRPWVAWVMPIEITLSVSGLYELIEWAVADVFFQAQGAAYLGTQGDIWDAQKDMALATLGAILATSIVSSAKRIFKIH